MEPRDIELLDLNSSLSFPTSLMMLGQGVQSCLRRAGVLRLLLVNPFPNLVCDHWSCPGRGCRQQERGGSGGFYDFPLILDEHMMLKV